jgi:hypothetical protein
MANGDSDRRRLNVWLPPLVLKFLVFLVFAFVLVEATVGLGDSDLPANRVWVIVVGLAGLLLLLAVDRLTELRISPGGLEARLREKKEQALAEVDTLDSAEVTEVARRQILEAESADQVEATKAMAVALNVQRAVERIKKAIRERRKCYVRYMPTPETLVETYHVAPLDIKPGETASTRARDYLWAHSYEHNRTVSLRLDRVRGVELSDDRFDPQELMTDWETVEPEWNVARDW